MPKVNLFSSKRVKISVAKCETTFIILCLVLKPYWESCQILYFGRKLYTHLCIVFSMMLIRFVVR